MSGFISRIFTLSPLLVYVVVGALVFAEDALFVGFVIPGETAAVIGGVAASRGHVQVAVVAIVVVLCAIVGDTAGYEVGRHVGPRLLASWLLNSRRKRLDRAQEFLRRRGGTAIFLGRFVAFFRAVMPALAGTARMPYRRFLAFNAAGGLVWGVGFVTLGYLAGNSYSRIEKSVGRGVALTVAVVVILAVLTLKIRHSRREKRGESQPGDATNRIVEDNL